MAGVGIAFASIAPSYALVVLGVLVSGIGVAAYHPEGSKFASFVSGNRRASGMSLFSVGGNIGFALGPLLASFFVITLGLGLDGGVLIVVPGLIVASALLFALPHLARFAPDEVGQARRSAAGNDWFGTIMLLAIVGLRSLAHMGLFTFIPLYELSRGNSAAYGTQMLARLPLRRRARDADRRAARRPRRAPPRAARQLHRGAAAHPRLRARRRPGRRARALFRGHGGDRHVRRHASS